ncbi:MAG: ABC transporter ATP-binding protein, partial [Oscillospiraceae bacterium]|nr:ABC transporter ATP-binding protein [Oscillospiraceae bacterium]
MKNVILSGKGIVKSFGENTVLHGIDIDVYEGDLTVIMGSSGSGKSTLLYALSGMDRISGGELFYREQNITNASEKELTKLRAGDLGFVFQKTHLINNLTLGENIRMAGLIGNVPDNEAKTRADELIMRMNLDNAKDRLPSQVSGGEAQRAAVARAVITKPVILFADEPTGALNKANSEEVLNLLSSLNADGQTVLLVTHDKEAALRGNRVL